MLDDVWVVEPSQNFDFTFDLFKDPLLLDVLFVQDFDRHFVVGYLVVGDCTG